MELPILIILAIVCVIIGYMLASLLQFLRREKSEELPSEESHLASGEIYPPADALQTRVPLGIEQPTTEGQSLSLTEILRVWRKSVEGDLVIEVSGTKAHSPFELDQDQRDRLRSLLQELKSWLGEEAARTEVFSIPSRSAGAPDTLSDQALSATGQMAEGSLGQARRPSLSPLNVVANALRAEVRKPPSAEEKSLASQVDAVLQEKIIGTPLEKRGIHLTDAPDGGLLVQVGREYYDGVEEIPDAEIQALIHSAVAEWGKRALKT